MSDPSKTASLKTVQKLLAEAKKLVDTATVICEHDGLDGVSFMGQTFRCFRDGYQGTRQHLEDPGWFTDEYWCSSSADCEIALVPLDDEEE